MDEDELGNACPSESDVADLDQCAPSGKTAIYRSYTTQPIMVTASDVKEHVLKGHGGMLPLLLLRKQLGDVGLFGPTGGQATSHRTKRTKLANTPSRVRDPKYWTNRTNTILYYSILYYTGLYYTILYWTILSYTGLYYTILDYTILYYTGLYYTILDYTILSYTILYYTILDYTILYYTILYYTILYWTILDYTGLYYTGLYHTGLYWTILYNINTMLYIVILR
jgi:hypothetical protein